MTFDKKSYESKVTESVETYNKDAVAPVDATIAYDDKTKKFKVVAEVPGTQYDTKTVLAAMADSISALQPNLKLTSDHLIQPKVFSTDERLVNSAELATGLVAAHVTLTMGGQVVSEIDGSNLSPFIRMDENMGVTLDEAGVDQWITDLSNGFDTVGTERTYTRPDGKVITISGGAYGWITDAPALKDQVVAAIKAGQTTTIDIPCEQTAFAYNGPGQPDWTNRYIDVDLSEQYVRFYGDDGSIIWESACISGTPDGKHNTWPGVWYITNKESPSKLIGYTDSGQKEYETTVSFWMAFEGNGIGLHDATWQPSFGGDMYASGYGSHGCVNLSYSAAESLYLLNRCMASATSAMSSSRITRFWKVPLSGGQVLLSHYRALPTAARRSGRRPSRRYQPPAQAATPCSGKAALAQRTAEPQPRSLLTTPTRFSYIVRSAKVRPMRLLRSLGAIST